MQNKHIGWRFSQWKCIAMNFKGDFYYVIINVVIVDWLLLFLIRYIQNILSLFYADFFDYNILQICTTFTHCTCTITITTGWNTIYLKRISRKLSPFSVQHPNVLPGPFCQFSRRPRIGRDASSTTPDFPHLRHVGCGFGVLRFFSLQHKLHRFGDMETFLIIGVCFLCYELFDFLYRCGHAKKDDFSGTERRRMIYTIPETRNLVS